MKDLADKLHITRGLTLTRVVFKWLCWGWKVFKCSRLTLTRTNNENYEIASIMAKIEGWKSYDKNKTGMLRFPIYNKQRAFVRVEDYQEQEYIA